MKPTHLTYIANVRLPTEKAHGIQIIKMCEAFANQGINVTLIAPQRRQVNKDLKQRNIFKYYRVKPIFNISFIGNLDLLPLNQYLNTPLFFMLQELTFATNAFIKTWNEPVVYTRSKIAAFLRALFNKPVVYEAHDSSHNSFIDKYVAKGIVVSITRSIGHSWSQLGAEIMYAPDGVGEEFFANISKEKARKKLNLQIDKKVILYTGNLYEWKGVDILALVARRLPKFLFYFVGGSIADKNIEPFRKKYKNVRNIISIGHRPYEEIPLWLRASDILVLPSSAKTKKSQTDTSPLKLFEYLASRTPIVASKVAGVTEIVSHREVNFCKPDDPGSLAAKINVVLSHQNHSHQKTEAGRKTARKYTWDKRAQKILNTIIK